LIVDPEHPGTNGNIDNNGDSGLVTNPSTGSNNGSVTNNNNNSNSTLPQTGEKSGLVASLLGLIVLTSVVYFRRRRA